MNYHHIHDKGILFVWSSIIWVILVIESVSTCVQNSFGLFKRYVCAISFSCLILSLTLTSIFTARNGSHFVCTRCAYFAKCVILLEIYVTAKPCMWVCLWLQVALSVKTIKSLGIWFSVEILLNQPPFQEYPSAWEHWFVVVQMK